MYTHAEFLTLITTLKFVCLSALFVGLFGITFPELAPLVILLPKEARGDVACIDRFIVKTRNTFYFLI